MNKEETKVLEPAKKNSAFDFVFTFLCPTIFGKILVVYFGTLYSAQPGKGYGYGLVLSIVFTLSMMGRFLWRYRDYDDKKDNFF